MQVKDILRDAALLLREADIDTPRLDAEILLSDLLKIDRFSFYIHPDLEITQEEYEAFQDLINRRINHEPVAYITGNKEFMGIDFSVKQGVLIPRPDTEILTEYAINLIKERGYKKVLDLCAGSGAIGLAIKTYCPDSELALSDISEIALEVIKENSSKLNLEARIIDSDLFENIEDKFDLIVSNPPYIKTSEIEDLSPEIKGYEPMIALDGGLEGYDFYVDIASQAKAYLNPGGCLILEIGDKQAQEVIRFLEDNAFENINLLQDLAGHDRVLVAFRI